jgi:hypothetical protein
MAPSRPIPCGSNPDKPGSANLLAIQNSKFKIQKFPSLRCRCVPGVVPRSGLISVKLMAFDCAVNTSIGLPFVRTSPDHGTAFDIAGQGVADATSMQAAIALAAELSRQRGKRG